MANATHPEFVMATEVTLPRLSPGMNEASVSRRLLHAGHQSTGMRDSRRRQDFSQTGRARGAGRDPTDDVAQPHIRSPRRRWVSGRCLSAPHPGDSGKALLNCSSRSPCISPNLAARVAAARSPLRRNQGLDILASVSKWTEMFAYRTARCR